MKYVSLIHRALKGESLARPPFWFMRQAGRYLPEYRELRAEAGDFLSLCYNPTLAAEVTLQPIRRFDMDAAIIFADILLVPQAMGATLWFEQGEGPKFKPVRDKQSIAALTTDTTKLLSIGESLKKTRAQLAPEKSLIGFCGAPWTVACYMVEGGGRSTFESVRQFARENETLFTELIDKLVIASADYLSMQVESGADVVQIFDSWAGVLDQEEFEKWSIAPTKKLIQLFKAKQPNTPVIGFPREANRFLGDYVKQTGVEGLSLDTSVDLAQAKQTLPLTLQGNLDPQLLMNSEKEAVAQTKKILETMRGHPFIFNLGHGIVQHTPIAHVEAVSRTIKEFA